MPYKHGDLHDCQYAGTLETSLTSKQDHHLFYWYFKNENEDAPLIVFINGGPGSTSMFGLFYENGPFRVNRTGSGKDDYVLYAPSYGSWADQYDIVFIDQPVNSGFSYGIVTLTAWRIYRKNSLSSCYNF